MCCVCLFLSLSRSKKSESCVAADDMAGWMAFYWFFFRCTGDYAFGVDLGAPFFPGGHELWHHPLAYSAAAAAELPSAALQHATLVHPALHPQVPVRSYLWLNPEKMIDQPMHQVSRVSSFYSLILTLKIESVRLNGSQTTENIYPLNQIDVYIGAQSLCKWQQ